MVIFFENSTTRARVDQASVPGGKLREEVSEIPWRHELVTGLKVLFDFVDHGVIPRTAFRLCMNDETLHQLGGGDGCVERQNS